MIVNAGSNIVICASKILLNAKEAIASFRVLGKCVQICHVDMKNNYTDIVCKLIL